MYCSLFVHVINTLTNVNKLHLSVNCYHLLFLLPENMQETWQNIYLKTFPFNET